MSHAPSTAWEVVDAAAAGSPAARDEFARRYGDWIRRQLAVRWRGTALLADVDDAVQEVFCECLKPRGVLVRADRAAVEGFRALLGAVVRNVALRAETARARHLQRHAPLASTQHAADASTIGRALDRTWAQGLVREAAAEMARRAAAIGEPAQRRVELLRLHFESGRSIPEIAADWGRDAAYVHHQYAKARADFQRTLLAVLAARCPGMSEAELRAQCREVVRLLRSD